MNHQPPTERELKRLFPHITQSCLRRTLGAVEDTKRKPSPKPALGGQPSQSKSRPPSLDLRITIVSCRHRLLDDDNLVAGAKPLRDAIARTFGLDDADKRIRFEYGQVLTQGEEGTVVKLERR